MKRKFMFYFFILLLILSVLISHVYSIQCMDENNEPVDWYVIYKIPKIKNENIFIGTGVAYMYITSKSDAKWTFSNYPINSSDSIVGNTLSPLYKTQDDIAYVLYNDQPPSEPSKPEKGHTKGVVLADANSGIWLIHSVPHFPYLGPKYNYSHTGLVKGQSFLCISMDLKNLNRLGIQLQYNQPQVYMSHIPILLKNKISEIAKTAAGVVVQQPPWFSKILVRSKGGTNFLSFAKSKEFGKDLYEDWLAPDLQSNLLVETWSNGAGKLPSNCSKLFKVYNVEDINFQLADVSFHSTQDHSKWVVSQNFSWICIGDINRMEHQEHRGGGTVCLNNKMLAADYGNLITGIENCHK